MFLFFIGSGDGSGNQYRNDLVYISGGLAKGLADKVGLTFSVFINGVLYSPKRAREEVSNLEKMRQEALE